MNFKKVTVLENTYIILHPGYFAAPDPYLVKWSVQGKELKQTGIYKPQYLEKLQFLDDDTFYFFDFDINSPYSIYHYCDYLKALKSLSDIA